MKAYLATTGTLFVLLVVAHVSRVIQETHLARDPWFIATTLLASALAVWASMLFHQLQRR